MCLLIAAFCHYAAPTPRRRVTLIVSVVLSTCLAGFMVGSRVDELGLLAAILWLRCASLDRFAIRPAMIATIAVVLVLMAGLGVVRQSIGSINAYNDSVSTYLMKFFEFDQSPNTLQFSQAGGVAITSCSTIGLLESGVYTYDYGKRFLDYISQTLPRSVVPDRPEGLAVELTTMQLSNGGMFIINEPLLAFGASGVAAALLLAGLACGKIERIVRRCGPGSMWFLVYAFFVFALNRAVMYGLFTLYKNVLAFGLVVAISRFGVMISRSRQRRLGGGDSYAGLPVPAID